MLNHYFFNLVDFLLKKVHVFLIFVNLFIFMDLKVLMHLKDVHEFIVYSVISKNINEVKNEKKYKKKQENKSANGEKGREKTP